MKRCLRAEPDPPRLSLRQLMRQLKFEFVVSMRACSPRIPGTRVCLHGNVTPRATHAVLLYCV